MALLDKDNPDPIQTALDHYREVAGYQVTVSSHHGGQVIRYAFKRPGLVRMEFITPHRGVVLVYDPGSGVAKLWPFGHGRFPALSLHPDNPLIQSPSGQRVDRSDVGFLYHNAQALQQHGGTEIVGVETFHGYEVLHLEVSGGGYAVGDVMRYCLWLDCDSGFPLKVVSQGAGGRLIEAVEMTAWHISPEFPADFFRQ